MIDAVVAALELPISAREQQRVAKAKLVEYGNVTGADRKAVDAGIDRIDWVATLKPGTIGVAAFSDDVREASGIAVLTVQLRAGANAARLTTLIHRAIPFPVLLVSGEGDVATLSLAPKRRSLGKGVGVIAEAIVTAPPVLLEGDDVQAAFLASLAVASLPSASLWSLYTGLIERVEAFAAARTGLVFRLPSDAAQAEARRAALIAHAMAVRELAQLRALAGREKLLARAVELAASVAAAKAELARAVRALDLG